MFDDTRGALSGFYGCACREDRVWSRVVLRFVVLYFRTQFGGNELEKGKEREREGRERMVL